MSLNSKAVRIIKRKQRERVSPEVANVPLEKTERQVEREMLQTVASWIDMRRELAKEFARTSIARGLRGLEHKSSNPQEGQNP